MHEYRMLTTPAELEQHLIPVLKANGSEIPKAGCYVAAVEFDEQGNVYAYQMGQNALFAEGMWSRGTEGHPLRLFRMLDEWCEKEFGAPIPLTFTRCDKLGEKIGRIAEKLGFERMRWNIFRRKQCR